MANVLWLLMLCAAAVCSSQANRIVGGEPTTIDRYPSIVQVEYRMTSGQLSFWVQYCAGSIITSRYVVSAAHCFDEAFSIHSRRILAGTTNRSIGGTAIIINQVFIHPSYGVEANFDADICVVQLLSSLTYSDVIAPVTVISANFELPDGLPVQHAGWGTTSQGGPVSPVLRDVTIFTINRELCAENYSYLSEEAIVTENMICAGILNVGGKDACDNDSGGPLYYDGILVGVISWGHGCGNETFPGVSTAVSPYTNWIVDTAV